ncbi:lectin subunit alpha-like [Haematobia irritans]|uniref:lectin subunit alpha-like n=1 Tax=Haematobia irritans TaxID=7368 RepID=UPI003F501ABF
METFAFLQLLLVTTFNGIVWAGKHYTTSKGSIYYIEHLYQYSWFEAYFECSYRNMSLYTIRDLDQFYDLHSLLMSGNFETKPPNLWIGAIGVKGKFLWIANHKTMDFVSLWGDNNPDNTNENEHCLQIWFTKRYLNDLNCERKIGFICENRIDDFSSRTPQAEGKYKGLTINFYQNNHMK